MSRAIELTRLRRGVNLSFMLVGAGLTLYIGVAVFGFIRNSAVHYTNFVLAILAMASLLLLQSLLDERIRGQGRRFWPIRVALALLATVLVVGGAGYLRVHAIRLERIQPFFEDIDFWVGLFFVAGVMILNWFHWGWLLTSLVILVMGYFFFGHLVPIPLLMHPEYDANFVMNYIGLGTTDGMFWLSRLAADHIYFLVIYAAILLGVGMLKMVIEIGKLTGNRVRGGAAFPAIIGSGIVASVMGQAVSNVVLTGRLTIPMMKSHGYRKEMAGAIEAVASTSGQIMPPVLGLAGFIIAVFLNVTYIEVAMAALIPALLFLSGTTIGIVVGAYRERLPRLREPVDMAVIGRLLPAFLVSFSAVIILLVGYYSPALAGLAGLLLALTMAPFQGRFRPKLKALYDAFEDGLVIVALLSLLLIAIGPLAQTFQTTNLAGRLGSILVLVLPDSTFLMLLGAMVVALLLGMGLPTPVAYLMVALTLVPFLQQIGIEPLLAHFFVFYFAVFSTLTPPVAVSALAAAKLSGGSFLGTAFDAMKLMLATFIIPFGFVYNPQLMSFPHLSWDVVPPVILLLILQVTSSLLCYGYFLRDLNGYERGMFGVVTVAGMVLLINGGVAPLAVFLALLAASAGWVFLTRTRAVGRIAGKA